MVFTLVLAPPYSIIFLVLAIGWLGLALWVLGLLRAILDRRLTLTEVAERSASPS